MDGGTKRTRVGCVVMASGAATRFGSNKLLAPLGGVPLLERTLSCLPPKLDAVVVTRWAGVAALCAARGVRCVAPESPLQSDTLRRGLDALGKPDGCLFLPGDQPLVTRRSILALLDAFAAAPETVCRLCWLGRTGSPVLFPRSLFGALRALKGDVGGGALLRGGAVPVTPVEALYPWELWDADTPQALERLEAALRRPITDPAADGPEGEENP